MMMKQGKFSENDGNIYNNEMKISRDNKLNEIQRIKINNRSP